MSEAEGLGLGAGAGAAERGEGLGARGEHGQPTQSGQPTPSAVGGREEVGAPSERASQEAASSRGAGCSGPEQPTLRRSGPEQPAKKPKKPRKRQVKLNKADRAVRDPMIYRQVRIEMRSVRSVAKMWKISPARVSQIVSDENRRISNSPQLFDLTSRQQGQRQSEAEFQMRGEQDLMFSRMKMQAATQPLTTRKTGHRGEIEYEETITREQKSEQLLWFREVRKLETQLRDHAARPVSPPPPDSDKSPWYPWECEAEAHAANWVQLVCQGIITRDDYDIWCARHTQWCQLNYPSFGDMVDKVLRKVPCMLWGLTPEKAMRMGTKIPGLERFADLAKAWIRDGGKLKDDWETPPPPEEDISPLPTWTLRTVDASGKGSFVVCDAAEAARGEGLGARGEQSRPLTPSGPGLREGAGVADGAAAASPAVGSVEEVARRVPSYERPVWWPGPSSQEAGSSHEAASSRGAGCSGPEQPTLGSGPQQPTLEHAPWNDTPPYPGVEADAQESWGPEWEVNISVSEKRRLTRESWDYLLEQQWVTPEEYAVYRERDAREFGEDSAPAADAEGPEALSISAADSAEVAQGSMPLAGGVDEWGLGLGARAGEVQAAVPRGEEVGARVEAAGETAPSCGAEQDSARRSAAIQEAASSSGAGCSGPEQPTLRRSEQPTLGSGPGQPTLAAGPGQPGVRRKKPPRTRREQRALELRERVRERRRQERAGTQAQAGAEARE